MADLASQLERLPEATRALLRDNHFDHRRFLRLAQRLQATEPGDNRVSGRVDPPSEGDITDLPAAGTPDYQRYVELGSRALERGECGFVLLAGGMATRMGGVVKALVEALPGRTFLDLRVSEVTALEHRFGRRPPLYLMTSYATDRETRQALGSELDGVRLAAFRQHVSLRLTPSGDLVLDESGAPSVHAHGHGDFLDAFRQSGLLGTFIEGGGRTIMVANLDNLGAALDPAVIGYHLSHGAPCTSEVVDKVGSDRGGIPVRLDGRLVVLEEFRLPSDFDPSRVTVFNVNTFCFDARALASLDLEYTYFTVKKQVDDATVIQFERLINELTFALETRYLRVPRSGSESRFLPVKDFDELQMRRPEIRSALEARGVLEVRKA
jgi:UTP--glucose-1-phosphate uridylyltransferase